MAEAFLYKPSAWQQEFHNLPHREALGAGSAGPGKTICLLMDPLHQIMVEAERLNPKHPFHISPGQSKGHALFLRRTMPMLLQTISESKRIFPTIDPGATYSDALHTWTFSSGFKYQFGHCKDPDDWMQYQGKEYTWIALDEANQFLEEQFNQITSRLRTSDPVLVHMLKIRLMSNPSMASEFMDGAKIDMSNWVRRRYVDPDPNGRVDLEEEVVRRSGERVIVKRIYLPAKLYDNPDPVFIENYELNLLTKPEHIRKALLEGDWYHTAGAYFADWDQRIHTCEPFAIPEHWPRFRSMDWGYVSPGVIHWWALDDEGTLFCTKEFKFQGRTPSEIAKDVVAFEGDMKLAAHGESMITGPADTQIWQRDGNSGVTIAAEFQACGVPWIKADKRSRARNALLLGERLRSNKKTTIPGVVFFRSCKYAIKTIPGVIPSLNAPEVPAEFSEDHAFDSVMYAMPFAANGRAGIPAKQKPQIYDDFEPDYADRGRYGYGSSVH